jgi:pSer/pThr/pTyr-binding forkhead associated (FHA) protein
MKLSLVVLSEGKAKGQPLPINLPQFLIGRDPQCQLRPASPMISKRHCAVLLKNGKAFVRDFDSTNGTFVNDEPIKGERELKNEDILKVGPLLFRVALEGTTPVNKPTPPPAKLPPTDSSEDDDVAAMLLALQDDSTSGGPEVPKDPDGVPQGSTVMDVPSPLAQDKPAEGEQKEKKADDKKPPPKKEESTSKLAAAILEKYTRRQRS